MGDLAEDTTVTLVSDDGTFVADLSRDWEIWGPMGGYVAAVALRAVGATVPHLRPATFSCHYLGVARFEPVDIRVETRKAGRTATSLRVEMTQDGRPILDGAVWAVDENEGLEHDEAEMPDVPHPDDLADVRELVPDDEPPFPFWLNFDAKPIDFETPWPPDGPRPAVWREWLLCDGAAPVSADGLFGWTAQVWSPGGLLHASGGGQCLYRRMQPPPG